jgi:hypothetical protein
MRMSKSGKPIGFVRGFDPKRNLKGRPKLGLTVAERIRDAMEEKIRPDGYSKMDALIDEAFARAKMGSFVFFDALMSRGYGKVPDKIELQTEDKPDLSKLNDEELATYAALLKKALTK